MTSTELSQLLVLKESKGSLALLREKNMTMNGRDSVPLHAWIKKLMKALAATSALL